MSSTYTYNSVTVAFTAITESWSEQSSSDVNVIGFPGGDAVAISLGGQRQTTRAFKALLTNKTDYTTLVGMRNRQGKLIVEHWDTAPVNAILQQIQPDPVQVDGQILAQVQFVFY